MYFCLIFLFEINGSQSDKDERFKAAQYVNDLKVGFISKHIFGF